MLPRRYAALVAATLVFVGCARRTPTPVAVPEPPPPVVQEAPPPSPPPPPPAPAPPPAAALTEEEIFARKSLDDLNAERPLGDVLFDLDESTIRADARNVLQRNSAWLLRWTSTRITVEGHADSRGTSEYNLALGLRRSQAVKDYLVGLGVDAGRILAISMGEESPLCTEEHEGCWQQNRRGHFVITAK